MLILFPPEGDKSGDRPCGPVQYGSTCRLVPSKDKSTPIHTEAVKGSFSAREEKDYVGGVAQVNSGNHEGRTIRHAKLWRIKSAH